MQNMRCRTESTNGRGNQDAETTRLAAQRETHFTTHHCPRGSSDDGSDMAQAVRLTELSGQQRLDRHAKVTRQLGALRRAGRS
jgi:hypothetical protein